MNLALVWACYASISRCLFFFFLLPFAFLKLRTRIKRGECYKNPVPDSAIKLRYLATRGLVLGGGISWGGLPPAWPLRVRAPGPLCRGPCPSQRTRRGRHPSWSAPTTSHLTTLGHRCPWDSLCVEEGETEPSVVSEADAYAPPSRGLNSGTTPPRSWPGRRGGACAEGARGRPGEHPHGRHGSQVGGCTGAGWGLLTVARAPDFQTPPKTQTAKASPSPRRGAPCRPTRRPT